MKSSTYSRSSSYSIRSATADRKLPNVRILEESRYRAARRIRKKYLAFMAPSRSSHYSPITHLLMRILVSLYISPRLRVIHPQTLLLSLFWTETCSGLFIYRLIIGCCMMALGDEQHSTSSLIAKVSIMKVGYCQFLDPLRIVCSCFTATARSFRSGCEENANLPPNSSASMIIYIEFYIWCNKLWMQIFANFEQLCECFFYLSSFSEVFRLH